MATEKKTKGMIHVYNTSRDSAKWQEKKRQTRTIAAKIAAIGGRDARKWKLRARKIAGCATAMVTEECVSCGIRKITRVNLCRDRACPICAWRRSRIQAARLREKIRENMSGTQYILVTLTVRNVEWKDLSREISHLNAAWKKLSQRKWWREYVRGAYRTIEITKGKDGKAHPHIHALVAVRPVYFYAGYVKYTTWIYEWRRALGVRYDPSLRVAKVHEIAKGIAEVTKYVSKPGTWDGVTQKDLEYLLRAIHGRKLQTSSGCLTLHDADDAPDADLLHIPGADAEEERHLCPYCGRCLVRVEYEWNAKERRYDVLAIGGGKIHGSTKNNSKDLREMSPRWGARSENAEADHALHVDRDTIYVCHS